MSQIHDRAYYNKFASIFLEIWKVSQHSAGNSEYKQNMQEVFFDSPQKTYCTTCSGNKFLLYMNGAW